jgi:hypothetical protein
MIYPRRDPHPLKEKSEALGELDQVMAQHLVLLRFQSNEHNTEPEYPDGKE